MKAPDQRYYDAMLIRAWRKFANGGTFAGWCRAEFGVWPNELPLLRCRAFYARMGIRVFVAESLPVLSCWLLACESDHDYIAVLNRLRGSEIDCEKAVRWSGYNQAADAGRRDALSAESVREAASGFAESQSRMNGQRTANVVGRGARRKAIR